MINRGEYVITDGGFSATFCLCPHSQYPNVEIADLRYTASFPKATVLGMIKALHETHVEEGQSRENDLRFRDPRAN